MLEWYIGEFMVSIINMNNSIKEPYSWVFRKPQILMFDKVSAPMTERNPRTAHPPHKINDGTPKGTSDTLGTHSSNATPHLNLHSVR